MQTAFLIFPHQLFSDISAIDKNAEVFLIEEYLFFRQYKFHKQKLVLHRASMKFYAAYLQQKNFRVQYIESAGELHDVRKLIADLHQKNFRQIACYDPCDDWLHRRIRKACRQFGMELLEHPTQLFLNSAEELKAYFGEKKKYFQTDFYIQQRKKLNILLDAGQKPIGGKWSFDEDNRLKYPKEKTPPKVIHPAVNDYYRDAIAYVEKNFPDHYGKISSHFIYPCTFDESADWLNEFLEKRFREFGVYEDAIVDREHILHHSLLTPMLNIGLLTPKQIIDTTLNYGAKNNIPINSIEGFIRQIIGWREFIRGVYVYKGREERTKNFWQFSNPVPDSFYTGTTGIKPIDDVIRKVLETGYCHHIERLMLLGNFMLLCEMHPDAVYRWFMELFIDSYDWVMVPNVYGMSQFADGGLMATKPYISGSSYVLKMSNYKKENWCEVWDALFWSFMNKQRNFFLSNPRLGMLIKTYDKMTEEKKAGFVEVKKQLMDRLYR